MRLINWIRALMLYWIEEKYNFLSLIPNTNLCDMLNLFVNLLNKKKWFCSVCLIYNYRGGNLYLLLTLKNEIVKTILYFQTNPVITQIKSEKRFNHSIYMFSFKFNWGWDKVDHDEGGGLKYWQKDLPQLFEI